MEAQIFSSFALVVLLVNAGFSLIVAYVGKEKGRSFAGFFFLSFFLSFIVGLLVAIALPSKSASQITTRHTAESLTSVDSSHLEGYIECPFCAESISIQAKICKHCRSDVGDWTEQRRTELLTKQEELRLAAEAEEIAREEQRKAQAAQFEADMREARLSREAFFRSGKFKLILAASAVALSMGLVVSLTPTQTYLLTKDSVDPASAQSHFRNTLKEIGFSPRLGGQFIRGEIVVTVETEFDLAGELMSPVLLIVGKGECNLPKQSEFGDIVDEISLALFDLQVWDSIGVDQTRVLENGYRISSPQGKCYSGQIEELIFEWREP